MKWKATKRPQIGDTRAIRRFAWLPVRVGEEIVWLEAYVVAQRREIQIEGWDQFPAWVDVGKSLTAP